MERQRRPGGVGLGVGLCLVVASPVVFVLSTMYAGSWWAGPEVDVPRDGRTHEVRLDRPGGDYVYWTYPFETEPRCSMTDRGGDEVDVATMPYGERTSVEVLGAGPPQASASFTAPRDGVVVMTCDDARSTPATTVGLGAVPNRLGFEVANWATLLSGPGIGLAGLVVLAATGVSALRAGRVSPARRRGSRGNARGLE